MSLSVENLDLFKRWFKSLVRGSISSQVMESKIIIYLQIHSIHDLHEVPLRACRTLAEAGFEEELERAIAKTLIQEVRQVVREQYTGRWDSSILEEFRQWIELPLRSSLRELGESLVNDKLQSRLLEYGYEIIAELRVEELFDIVVDFPDSTEALKDLKICMTKHSQRANAVLTFQKSCLNRLLQGGATTADIISGYISTIKAFSILDPKGVLLDMVSRPIRKYLRDREDTIYVIISGMLGRESSGISELSEYLAESSRKSNDQAVDDMQGLDWIPDPIDAPSDFFARSSDIINCLLTLYDNKEVFIKEFTNMFGDLMLRDPPKVEDVMITLELLKLKFGERELQSLEVMVKDINDSRRVNNSLHVAGRAKKLFTRFNASILSRLFWPTFRDTELRLPSDIVRQFDIYASEFSKLKQGRRLKWAKGLGTAKIELQLEDRTLTIDVTPEQLAVIAYFQDGPKSIRDASQEFSMSESSLTQVVLFWVGKGVLKNDPERPSVYYVLEKAGSDQETGEYRTFFFQVYYKMGKF